jgi:hypothetical protein
VLDAAEERAAQAGYVSSTGDLGCDAGAAEALGLDPRSAWGSVAVYFDSEATAETVVAAFATRGGDVMGIAPVTLYCAD